MVPDTRGECPPFVSAVSAPRVSGLLGFPAAVCFCLLDAMYVFTKVNIFTGENLGDIEKQS